jgi:GTP pyrophosphokinase
MAETQREAFMNSVEKQAMAFAIERHGDQVRDEGIPYVVHPIRVALELIDRHYEERFQNTGSIVPAALLHDVVEDTETTIVEVESAFGAEIAIYVAYLTFKKKEGESFQERSTRMVDELAAAPWQVRAIKLADRFDNVTSCSVWPGWKIKRYLKATRYLLERIGHTDYMLRGKVLVAVREKERELEERKVTVEGRRK